MTEFQSFVHDLPELVHVAFRRARNINQIDRNDALVEASIVLMDTRLVVQSLFRISECASIGEAIRCKE